MPLAPLRLSPQQQVCVLVVIVAFELTWLQLSHRLGYSKLRWLQLVDYPWTKQHHQRFSSSNSHHLTRLHARVERKNYIQEYIHIFIQTLYLHTHLKDEGRNTRYWECHLCLPVFHPDRKRETCGFSHALVFFFFFLNVPFCFQLSPPDERLLTYCVNYHLWLIEKP